MSRQHLVGPEKSNRVAIADWGSTLRLALLRLVSGGTMVALIVHGTDLLRAILGR